jgi:hypothetical protein
MRIPALLLSFLFALSALAADVTGQWALAAKDPDGNVIKAVLTLKEDGGKLSGTIGTGEGGVPLTEVEFKDNTLTCRLTYHDMPVKLSLKLDGDKLSGVFATDSGDTGPVEAVREKAAPAAAAAAATPAGLWKLVTTGSDNDQIKLEVTLKLEGGKWSGRMTIAEFNMDVALTEVQVNGSDVSFQVPTDQGVYKVVARVTGDKFEGTSEDPAGAKAKVSGAR